MAWIKVEKSIAFSLFLTGRVVRAKSNIFYGFIRTFMTIAAADNPVIFFHTAVVVFMVGLVSEQVAQLRYDRSESRD